MFKIGDKVKITAKKSLTSFRLAGRISTIKSINETKSYVILTEDDEFGVWFDELTLIPKIKKNLPEWF